jgi:hypothetical protein
LGRRAYYGTVWARASRTTVAFLKSQILVGLAIAVVTAIVTGAVSADVGEAFNVQVAIYAAVVASLAVALFAFAWNVVASPWWLYKEQAALVEAQAARIAELERRPDVGRLVELREHGIQLMNYPVRNDSDLASLQTWLRAWENDTTTALTTCATPSELSSFRVLGSMTASSFTGAFNEEHNHEKMMLNTRLARLLAIITRIEGGAW